MISNDEIEVAANQFCDQFGSDLFVKLCRDSGHKPDRDSMRFFLVGLTVGFNNAMRIVRDAAAEEIDAAMKASQQ